MTKGLFCSLIAFLSVATAQAELKLLESNKAIICYADDAQELLLNAKRTTLKYTVEGESNGPKKILRTISVTDSMVSFISEEGTLTISKQGDRYTHPEDSEEDAQPVNCRLK